MEICVGGTGQIRSTSILGDWQQLAINASERKEYCKQRQAARKDHTKQHNNFVFFLNWPRYER